MLFVENGFHSRENIIYLENFFVISVKKFSYLGKNVIYAENIFGMSGKFF